MASNLLKECLEGYNAVSGTVCPYLRSSDCDLAWRAGYALRGGSEPTKCSKGRGYTVRIRTVGGSAIDCTYLGKTLDQIVIDRN